MQMMPKSRTKSVTNIPSKFSSSVSQISVSSAFAISKMGIGWWNVTKLAMDLRHDPSQGS